MFQTIVIAISLAVEAIAHESIVISGFVFTLVGLGITILAVRSRDSVSAFFGGSAIAFTLLIVFLINYNSWVPDQGNRPITILSWMYASIAFPVSVWLWLVKMSRGNYRCANG